MAAVDGISLDAYGAGKSSGAVALSLVTASRRSRLRQFPNDQWEIEMRAGADQIIARTCKSLSHDTMLDEGIEMIHRALDLLSVEELDHLVALTPANNYISLSQQNGKRTIRYFAVIDLPMEINVKMQIRRADGTIETPPAPGALPWASAFRFYRLSQSNNDLFDAFRNLYLSLEAVLDQLWPKKKREREKVWLDRALSTSSTKVNYALLATPGVADPARDVANRIYDVRVHLFHAKTGRTLLPDHNISYRKIAEAYRTLVSLWTEIVRAWLGLARAGGAVTYSGFKRMLEGPYAETRIAITADDTTADKADQAASPKGMPVIEFVQRPTVSEIRPGYMGVTCQTTVSDLPAGQIVGRVLVVLKDGKPGLVNSIRGGLTLVDADIFEIVNVLRLINRGQPRTEFS